MAVHPFHQPVFLSQIQARVGGEIFPNLTKDYELKGCSTLQDLDRGWIACLHNSHYRSILNQIQTGGVCILPPQWVDRLPPSVIGLAHPKPYRAFAQVLKEYAEKKCNFEMGKMSSQASIHPSATIGAGCCVDPFVVIGKNVKIGERCWIQSHTVIAENVAMGEDCTIESHVTITHATLGHHVQIQSGSRIGQSGFGFHMDEEGHLTVPQLGRVQIGDYVEIGANTTIDRGSLEDTVIGNRCRIDNLVQIAHNVVLGEGCVLVAQVGIAGSTRLGRFVVAGGQVGIAGHLTIGDRVQIAAKSGVMRNIMSQQTVGGFPALPIREWHRNTATLKKIARTPNSPTNSVEPEKFE